MYIPLLWYYDFLTFPIDWELPTHCISKLDSSGVDESDNLKLLEDICGDEPGSEVHEKESEINI
jgi:hypothetical protein